MRLRWLHLVLLLLVMTSYSHASERESTICGWLKERLVFSLWSFAAPKPNASRINSHKYVEHVNFTTSDNKKLSGYAYRTHNNGNKETGAKGYILVALGNAMFADQMIGEFKDFTKKGYDVFIYDYRGYGNS